MATDVKPSLMPMPAPAGNAAAPKKPAAVSRGAEGKSFADELNGSNPAENAQQAVRDNAGRVQKAGDKLQDKLSDAAGRPTAPVETTKGVKKPAGQVLAEPTLDEKQFRLAMREHAQKARATDPVAFLSGRLETIDPGSIADLVADNPFISQALASGDIESFMRQPMPVETLLSQFDVDDEIVSAVAASGIDLSGTITPHDFLRGLGVDPSRVSSELDMLADALPIDGVGPYVQRAQRLQGKRPESDAPELSSAQEATNKVKIDQARRQVAERADSPLAAMGAMQSPKVTPRAGENEIGRVRDLASVAPAVKPMRSPAAGLAGGEVSSRTSMSGLNPSGLEAGVDAATAPIAQSLPQRGVVETAKVAGPTSTASDLSGLVTTAAEVGSEAIDALPRMRSTKVDPFALMGERPVSFESLDGAVKQPPSPLGSTETVAEALLQSQWTPGKPIAADLGKSPAHNATLEQIAQLAQVANEPAQESAFGLNPTGREDGSVTGAMVEIAAEEVGRESTWQASSGPAAKAAEHWTRNLAVVAPRSPQATLPLFKQETRIPVDELQLDPTQWMRETQETSSVESQAFSEGDGNQGSLGFRSDAAAFGQEAGARVADLSLGESSFVSALTGEGAGPTTAERAQALQQIMDRASMMVRTRGGSVQLDFTGLNMGPLELAISVAGNRVDLKVLTESEHVRDVLAGDLSALRDALASQNMTLASVNVGVDARDGESARGQFAGSQQFQQGAQDHARDFSAEIADFLSGVKTTGEPRTRLDVPARMPALPSRAYSQGQIAVRV